MNKLNLIMLKIWLFFFIFGCGAFAQVSSEFLSEQIIDMANKYYALPYPDAPRDLVERTINAKKYKIYRPNHGLAHATRKAALALDTLDVLKNVHTNRANWVKARLSNNPDFAKQLSFAMLMLRTGRSSEANTKYKEDCYKSAEYFVQEAKNTELFTNDSDIKDFEFAFQAIGDSGKCYKTINNNLVYTDENGCTMDRLYLHYLIYGIHHLDLRRMVGFDKQRILLDIAGYLGFFDQDNKPHADDENVKKLWQRSGQYLTLSGDRDMDGMPPNHRLYKNAFFILSSNPHLLLSKVADLQKTWPTTKALTEDHFNEDKTTATPETELSIIRAEASTSDPWYPYIKRLSIASAKQNNLYSEDTLKKAASLRYTAGTHVPWTFKAQAVGDKALFSLESVVADRIVDPISKKTYLPMYHGTTSDFLKIFEAGTKAIAFNRAGTTTLGMGFYLTANLNEAKYYACERLKSIKKPDQENDIEGMVLVIGVEENALIKGKFSLNVNLSNDKTGEPLDPEIFFKRNGRLYNQFNTFTNISPYLKIFKIILLPNGFGKSKGISDYDGLPINKQIPSDQSFTCNI